MKNHKPLPKRMIVRSQGYAGPPVNRQKFAAVVKDNQTVGVIQRGRLFDTDADPRADSATDRAEINNNGS